MSSFVVGSAGLAPVQELALEEISLKAGENCECLNFQEGSPG